VRDGWTLSTICLWLQPFQRTTHMRGAYRSQKSSRVRSEDNQDITFARNIGLCILSAVFRKLILNTADGEVDEKADNRYTLVLGNRCNCKIIGYCLFSTASVKLLLTQRCRHLLLRYPYLNPSSILLTSSINCGAAHS
jgi:hypothetical protein